MLGDIFESLVVLDVNVIQSSHPKHYSPDSIHILPHSKSPLKG